MSQISREAFDHQRRSFEGRAEALLVAQQKIFRLAQALSSGDYDKAVKVLQTGVALDVPLQFEGPQSVPGADRFRPEVMKDLSCSTLLGIFVAQKQVAVFDWLLKQGANPAQVFADNRDAAWIAMLVDENNMHRRLLLAGARPNLIISDGSKTTRLMVATDKSEPVFVEQILQFKGNAAAYDARGRTALHINMAKSPYTSEDMLIAEMLLAAGANPNAEDLDGVPPHLLAIEPAAKSVLEGHELTVRAEVALAAKIAMEQAMEAENEQKPSVRDPAEPDLPQIKNKPKKFRPKPPRL